MAVQVQGRISVPLEYELETTERHQAVRAGRIFRGLGMQKGRSCPAAGCTGLLRALPHLPALAADECLPGNEPRPVSKPRTTRACALPGEADQQMRDGLVTKRE